MLLVRLQAHATARVMGLTSLPAVTQRVELSFSLTSAWPEFVILFVEQLNDVLLFACHRYEAQVSIYVSCK